MLDDDVILLRDNEVCAAITFQSIEKHLLDEHIHFSFLIKKNIKEAPSSSSAHVCRIKETSKVGVKSKTAGSLRGNNVKKCQSIPDVKLSFGGVLKKEVELDETTGSKNQPPDYSSINKITNNKQFTSPAHSTEAMKRNDEELVVTNLSGFNLNVVKRP